MSEPKNFGDLLERITPYIHLEEARTVRREEADRKDKRNPRPQENENRIETQIGEGDKQIRPHATSSWGRYNNRPREYHPWDRTPLGLGEMDMVPRLWLSELCGRCQTLSGFRSLGQLKKYGLWLRSYPVLGVLATLLNKPEVLLANGFANTIINMAIARKGAQL